MLPCGDEEAAASVDKRQDGNLDVNKPNDYCQQVSGGTENWNSWLFCQKANRAVVSFYTGKIEDCERCASGRSFWAFHGLQHSYAHFGITTSGCDTQLIVTWSPEVLCWTRRDFVWRKISVYNVHSSCSGCQQLWVLWQLQCLPIWNKLQAANQ